MTPTKFKSKLEKMTDSFEVQEFPYKFLDACGKLEPTIRRLRNGDANESDIDGGVLQRSHIHIKACEKGKLLEAMEALRSSSATKKRSNKVKFLLACDGQNVILDIRDDRKTPTLEFAYHEFPDYMQYLRPLAGLSPVKKQAKGFMENEVDASAAKKLNNLYNALKRNNPDWERSERRSDIHQFLARLIFCFFAEDTGVFRKKNIFTNTIREMSAKDGCDTDLVIAGMFRDMNDKEHDGDLRWVNGDLFAGSLYVPRFGDKSLRLLIEIGGLKWTEINPDIFGSMIQAIASDEERSRLGMHYTSEQNIMRVLTPLFLDALEAEMKIAGRDKEKLTALRERIARIRVFDPACGSGNFLVIAYKSMRELESRINKILGDPKRESVMRLTNFRGIEYSDFPARITRLALVISQFQCDEKYRGHARAVSDLLPLGDDDDDWITNGNALRRDWVSVCHPTSEGVDPDAYGGKSLKETKQAAVEFEYEGGEVYICGNPPFISAHGSQSKSTEQSGDMSYVFSDHGVNHGELDYAAAWFIRAAEYMRWAVQSAHVAAAFISTASICKGAQAPLFWPSVLRLGCRIGFAYTSFQWKNHAPDGASVSVVIVGLANGEGRGKIFSVGSDGETVMDVDNINPYLRPGENTVIRKSLFALCEQSEMRYGNKPLDNKGGLTLSREELKSMSLSKNLQHSFIRRYVGNKEFVKGTLRYCLWIDDRHVDEAMEVKSIRMRLDKVREARLSARSPDIKGFTGGSHKFLHVVGMAKESTIIVPRVFTGRREYLPVGLCKIEIVVGDTAFALFDAPLWNVSLLSSRLHFVWVASVTGRWSGFQYSNTLCWNTFPIPKLTTQNKWDMKKCAEDILVERKRCPGKTIADLYDPDKMPDNLRDAHTRNDDLLADIYVGRDFRDDTDMRETLFRMYADMTKDPAIMAKLKKPPQTNSPTRGGLFDD